MQCPGLMGDRLRGTVEGRRPPLARPAKCSGGRLQETIALVDTPGSMLPSQIPLGGMQAHFEGILYAADPIKEGGAGADIINMSLGATFARSSDAGTTQLVAALDQATTYAHGRGALIVASAGNGDRAGHGINHDNGNYVTVPAQSDHVVGVSALGPVGFALGETNFDRLASYSTFGNAIVDLSGPGGDSELPGTATCTLAINPAPPLTDRHDPATLLGLRHGCKQLQGTTTRNVCFAAGTSMSAPAVSGVAALVVGQNGRMNPDALLTTVANSADDLGTDGTDPVYGRGRVNALRAVQ
jgi:subtilisin family serine protease